MLIAQAAIFFAAGYETSSTTQSFALYEMAKNQAIQERVRMEIATMLATTNGQLTYDSVMHETPYLTQVITETLRLYPVLAFLDRECINPQGHSLEPFSSFVIPYKMPVFIPIYALHLDDKYFPHPQSFNPERFSTDNKINLIPFSHLPFGGGSRDCIGKRFAILQVKTAIIKILREYRLEPTAATPQTIMMKKDAFFILSEKPLIVNFKKDILSF